MEIITIKITVTKENNQQLMDNSRLSSKYMVTMNVNAVSRTPLKMETIMYQQVKIILETEVKWKEKNDQKLTVKYNPILSLKSK